MAALTAWSVCASEAQARTRCHSRACNERAAMHRCSQTRPRWCVERAIITYRLDGWQSAWMRRIPSCESGWQPLAYYPSQIADTAAERMFAIANDRSAGLYAFKPSTWRTTPYARRSLWLAKWNALAAGWMVRVHRAPYEWSCR